MIDMFPSVYHYIYLYGNCILAHAMGMGIGDYNIESDIDEDLET